MTVEFDAVVLLAFFVEENVRMTDRFLGALADEPGLGQALLMVNRGLASGYDLVEERCEGDDRLTYVEANEWPYYRMWNRGYDMARAEAVAVLNNDIEWPRGALQFMAGQLLSADLEVAAVVPNYWLEESEVVSSERERIKRTSRARLTACWIGRGDLFERVPPVDERYETWYGDNELELEIERAGLAVELCVGVPMKHVGSATTRHQPGIDEMRKRDRKLFVRKWGPL